MKEMNDDSKRSLQASLCVGKLQASEQRCPSIRPLQTELELEQLTVMVLRSWYNNQAKQSRA